MSLTEAVECAKVLEPKAASPICCRANLTDCYIGNKAGSGREKVAQEYLVQTVMDMKGFI